MEQEQLNRFLAQSPVVDVRQQRRAAAEKVWLEATPVFVDAYSRASTAIQRALQATHRSFTPGGMLESLELLACDAALPVETRADLLTRASHLRLCGVEVPHRPC